LGVGGVVGWGGRGCYRGYRKKTRGWSEEALDWFAKENNNITNTNSILISINFHS
jgi:hypothetical protein